MQANVWNPTKEKLPTRHDPDLPIWKFKAETGIPEFKIRSEGRVCNAGCRILTTDIVWSLWLPIIYILGKLTGPWVGYDAWWNQIVSPFGHYRYFYWMLSKNLFGVSITCTNLDGKYVPFFNKTWLIWFIICIKYRWTKLHEFILMYRNKPLVKFPVA